MLIRARPAPSLLTPLTKALGDLHYQKIHLPRIERITAALAQQIGCCSSLLDVGCGDGSLARQLAIKTDAERVCGVDVLLQPSTTIEISSYDGRHLPYEDRSFEVVLLSDVLHHAQAPVELLRECLRVASRVVALKDHFTFGALSSAILLAMDQVGNAASGVQVRGNYFRLPEWFDMVAKAGGRLRSLCWPLRIHDLPWRLVTRSELQFTALIERAPD